MQRSHVFLTKATHHNINVSRSYKLSGNSLKYNHYICSNVVDVVTLAAVFLKLSKTITSTAVQWNYSLLKKQLLEEVLIKKTQGPLYTVVQTIGEGEGHLLSSVGPTKG